MNDTEIKQLRKDFGISQMALSKKSGISRYRLSLFENGHLELTKSEQEALRDAVRSIAMIRIAKAGGL